MYATIPDAVDAIRRGEIIIVQDHPGREDEGDLVMAAEHVTDRAVNFMVTHGRGLLCLPMDGDALDALRLPAMVPATTAAETAFTISIDLDEPGHTGISAGDRARCIRRAVHPQAVPTDFRRPGHVFPLRAERGGVLARPGHTEAAVDLARLAGLTPAGVICEILDLDGSMARGPRLEALAREHGLLAITVDDLIAHRRQVRPPLTRRADAVLPTPFGPFRCLAYGDADGTEHLALVRGRPAPDRTPLVRVHSECLTGDVLASLRCDCGLQLRAAMRAVAEADEGVIVYLRGHEGRGIGLTDKLRAYQLQDAGRDTVDANVELGLPVDARDYGAAAAILADLGVPRVRLLTNNPAKVDHLRRRGIAVEDREPLRIAPTAWSSHYLRTKQERMGHDLDAGPGPAAVPAGAP